MSERESNAWRLTSAAVKFFGSWPRADHLAHDARAHADERWRAADDWINGLRDSISD